MFCDEGLGELRVKAKASRRFEVVEDEGSVAGPKISISLSSLGEGGRGEGTGMVIPPSSGRGWRKGGGGGRGLLGLL